MATETLNDYTRHLIHRWKDVIATVEQEIENNGARRPLTIVIQYVPPGTLQVGKVEILHQGKRSQ